MPVQILSLFAALLMVGSAMVVTSPAIAAPKYEEQSILIDVGGFRLNSVLLEADRKADLPPIVFIHGASANLYDPMFSFRTKLQGRAKLLFVDRPGHGNSDIGGEQNVRPDGQADAIAVLMKMRGITRAIIVGHSFGGAIAASLAVRHPDMVLGLVFLSPAVYPWNGGTAWYYEAASTPVTGVLFSTLIAPPIGLAAIDRATRGVFAPNPVPPGYLNKTRALQALRPVAFWHNAREVAALSDWAKAASANYRKIKTRTVIITGDTDRVVSPAVHSRHLARDIRGARLIVVHNLGHKSDFVASDLAVAAIETVAGRSANLTAVKRDVERRIANDGKD
jgi:pimeloyl-ACP methyl ester carboxylesterase